MRISKFAIPEIIFGRGSIVHLASCAKRVGARRVLLVSDQGLVGAGWVDRIQEILRDNGLEWIFFDLKQIDPEKHKKATHTSNDQILKNARLLADRFQGRLIFRIPLIPGFNDDNNSLTALAEFISSIGKKEVNIIPVHHLGREKHFLLGRNYYTNDFRIPSSGELQGASRHFTDAGLTCYLGSETPF